MKEKMTFFAGAVLAVSFFFLWSANPVHGVLTLVGLGLGFAGALLGQGLEFAALIVVLVYVGAVTVLFIFVVMMVNLRVVPVSYLTAESAAAAAVLVATAGAAFATPRGGWLLAPGGPGVVVEGHRTSNLNGLGWAFYGTEGLTLVGLVGLTLLIAMISAICLSLTGGENYRSQEFYSQVRKPNAVFVLQPLLLPYDQPTNLSRPVYPRDGSDR